MKVNKNRLKIRPRPFRLLGYLLWMSIMAVMFLMFRSFLLLFFSCFLILIPWISVSIGFITARRIGGSINVYLAGYSRLGDEVCPVIRITDPLWIGTLDVTVTMSLQNIFLPADEESILTASLPVIARSFKNNTGESTLRIPFSTVKSGEYVIRITSVSMQDWLGLLRYSIKDMSRFETETVITVLPPTGEADTPDPESISAGMKEVEESNRRGNDFSEVTDIREYEPGDRIRDIHWKLSARSDEWMVKIRTQMAGMELNVVPEFDADPEKSEQIFTATYQAMRAWSEGETDIHLRVYDLASLGFDSYIISDVKSADAAFAAIMQKPYSSRIIPGVTKDALTETLNSRYPYMGGYVRFGVLDDGSIGWEVISS